MLAYFFLLSVEELQTDDSRKQDRSRSNFQYANFFTQKQDSDESGSHNADAGKDSVGYPNTKGADSPLQEKKLMIKKNTAKRVGAISVKP